MCPFTSPRGSADHALPVELPILCNQITYREIEAGEPLPRGDMRSDLRAERLAANVRGSPRSLRRGARVVSYVRPTRACSDGRIRCQPISGRSRRHRGGGVSHERRNKPQRQALDRAHAEMERVAESGKVVPLPMSGLPSLTCGGSNSRPASGRSREGNTRPPRSSREVPSAPKAPLSIRRTDELGALLRAGSWRAERGGLQQTFSRCRRV